MTSNGLLVLTSPLLKLPEIFSCYLPQLMSYSLKHLYVHLLPNQSQLWPLKNQIETRKNFVGVIRSIYGSASRFPSLDVRILSHGIKDSFVMPPRTRHGINLSFFENSIEQQSIEQYQDNFILNCSDNLKSVKLNLVNSDIKDCGFSNIGEFEKLFERVVLGGTFDRLHNGHKVFLTEAILQTKNELVVGVSDGDLLKNKTLKELILPFETRKNDLLDYLQDVDPTIKYDIIQITDPFGPTITVPDIDLIVGSEETERGCIKINDIRAERGMKPLLIHIVTLQKDPDRIEIEEEKISSSSQRMRLLGTKYRESNSDFKQDRPFIIGLTGGSASGKSSICRYLEKLGATIIDCDKLGHEAYRPGTPGFEKVKNAFGSDIVASDGTIDRKILGSKVFGNQDQLKKLQNIIWPEIARLTNDEISKCKEKGIKVVILDAAVLLEANWDHFCDEVWLSIIPVEEAIKRIMERDGKTRAEAEQRLASQMNNSERLKRANVVFSSLWDYGYTKSQVDRAWCELLVKINKK